MKKKILLIHGWDYKYYYHLHNTRSWDKRNTFLKELSKKYDIYYPDLPGFGLEKEPIAKKWKLDDYANFIYEYIKNNNLKIDYILGYSFGGPVALKFKQLFDHNIKEILISPALIRNTNSSRKFLKTPKLFNPIRNLIRDYYLIKKLKVDEMVHGKKFLRNTYQDIVRVNMLKELDNYNENDFLLIYGDKDTLVNPSKVLSDINPRFKKRIKIIVGGDHDIGENRCNEVIRYIDEFIK